MAAQSAFSLCPVCLKRIPAQYVTEEDTVYLAKECDKHGSFRNADLERRHRLAAWCQDAEKSEDNPTCPESCGLCDSHLRKTCCAILNVTERCNLKCNYCFEGDLSGQSRRWIT